MLLLKTLGNIRNSSQLSFYNIHIVTFYVTFRYTLEIQYIHSIFNNKNKAVWIPSCTVWKVCNVGLKVFIKPLPICSSNLDTCLPTSRSLSLPLFLFYCTVLLVCSAADLCWMMLLISCSQSMSTLLLPSHPFPAFSELQATLCCMTQIDIGRTLIHCISVLSLVDGQILICLISDLSLRLPPLYSPPVLLSLLWGCNLFCSYDLLSLVLALCISKTMLSPPSLLKVLLFYCCSLVKAVEINPKANSKCKYSLYIWAFSGLLVTFRLEQAGDAFLMITWSFEVSYKVWVWSYVAF